MPKNDEDRDQITGLQRFPVHHLLTGASQLEADNIATNQEIYG
jgi:hypothetical protein